MAILSVQSIIKELRVKRGLSQQQLCAGLCSQEQLSRIERGLHTPNWFTYRALLERLGESPEQYIHSVVSGEDKRVYDIESEVAALMLNRRYGEVSARLDILEQDKAFSSPIHQTWLLTSRAAVTIADDPKKAMGLVMSAMRIARPDFDIDDIDSYLLTTSEISRLNTLAIAVHHVSGCEAALRIFLSLMHNIEHRHYDEKTYSEMYLMVSSNLTHALTVLNRFEECYEYTQKGIQLALRYEQYRFFTKFHLIKTACLFNLGRREEALSSLRQTVYLLRGHERHQECNNLLEKLEREFGVRVFENMVIEAPGELVKLPQPDDGAAPSE